MNDPLRLDQQLCFPLYAASNLLTRRYRPLLDDLGLTYPQYLVMLLLWEKSPRTVGELGRGLFLDSGTLTPLLKRLAAQGIIARQRAEDDERRVMISLTDAGIALKSRAMAVPGAMLCQLSMTPEQLHATRTQLQSLLALLARVQA